MRRHLAVAGLLLLAPGCVRRALVVESEPPGAEVWIDGENLGPSPVRVPFDHYGRREIVLSKGGYALIRGTREIAAPWYERFPLDFFAENLWPGTLVDERYFFYTLSPEESDPEGVYQRAKSFREAEAPKTSP